MIGALVGMALALVALTLLLAVAGARIERLQDRVEDGEDMLADQQDANHAKCIAHIADVTSKRIVALALRDLAGRYAAGEEDVTMRKIERTIWTPDGPPLPALLMLHHAERLDPTTTGDSQ